MLHQDYDWGLGMAARDYSPRYLGGRAGPVLRPLPRIQHQPKQHSVSLKRKKKYYDQQQTYLVNFGFFC
jgi:hypothetical protein